MFSNNSNNVQIPAEEQVAITLYRFGHSGNTASQAAVARWAGAGKCSAQLHTKQVMTVVLRWLFMEEAVQLPNDKEREEAEQWVERNSCRAWRDGWLFVDGTLVLLDNFELLNLLT